jgi:hypothetical protein
VLCVLVLLVGVWALAYRRDDLRDRGHSSSGADAAGRGEKEVQGILARDLEGGKGVAGAVDHAEAILEGILRDAPTTTAKSAA